MLPHPTVGFDWKEPKCRKQRTAIMIFCTRSRLMSERLWQTALADHCIYKRLKNLRLPYWRLIWRQNCFAMWHWQSMRRPPKSGCCGPAEATYKLFSRQWRKKKVTSGSFPLSCGLSWHNATIFLIKLSSWRIYLFVRRPVTSILVSFWLKSSNVDYDGFWMELLFKILAACIGKQRTIPENRKS